MFSTRHCRCFTPTRSTPSTRRITPDYWPGQQRICRVPDGDMFRAIRDGKVKIPEIFQHVLSGRQAWRTESLWRIGISPVLLIGISIVVHPAGVEHHDIARFDHSFLVRQRLSQIVDEGCEIVAHAASSKGNDQVRMETALASIGPNLEVKAVVREWNLKNMDDKLRYARKRRLPAKYVVNAAAAGTVNVSL